MADIPKMQARHQESTWFARERRGSARPETTLEFGRTASLTLPCSARLIWPQRLARLKIYLGIAYVGVRGSRCIAERCLADALSRNRDSDVRSAHTLASKEHRTTVW